LMFEAVAWTRIAKVMFPGDDTAVI
jgi:hypothetical protein